MLYFFKSNDQLGEFIAAKLADISAAHKLFPIDSGESYLSEYENDFKGKEAVIKFLESYGQMLSNQRLISADACYIDPESGSDACII